MPLGVVAIWLGLRTRHYPYLNDFWPLLFQAGTFDWSTLDSLRNGFFPPGYAIFLRLITSPRTIVYAYYAGVAFTIGTVLTSYVMAARLASPMTGIVAAALTAFHPLTFSLTMTTGPDSGCVFMLFLALSLLLVASEAERPHPAAEWLAAALFFVAILWRYHALVFGGAAILASAAVYRPRVPWRAALGVVAALAVFAVLSLLPGLSPQLARAQAFGVWEAMHPVNWYHMPTDIPESIAAVIRADPRVFLRAYWTFHRPHLWMFAIPMFAALAATGPARRAALTVVVLEVLYVPISGLGTSPRGIAPMVPASMLTLAILIEGIGARLRPRVGSTLRLATAATAIAFAGLTWWPANRAFLDSSIAGYEWRAAVETELRRLGVAAPLQVFGDAGFHFVLRHGPGWYAYLPRSNGGWPRLDLYGLERIAPELDTTSLDAFVADCARSGITHIVIGSSIGGLVPDLGRVYAGQLIHPHLVPAAQAAGFQILEVRPGA